MTKINELNLKIEQLQNEYDNCFNIDGEIIDENYVNISNELSNLKKEQKNIVNKNSLLKIDNKEFSLSKDKITDLMIPFLPVAEEYIEYIWDIENIKKIKPSDYTDEICKKAKRLRIDISKIRNATKKIKDEEKKIVLQIWNVTQKCHNTIVKIIEEQEDILEKIELHFENLEKERVLKLTIERQELLKPYEVENLWMLKLWEMEEAIFNNFLQWCKTTFEQNKIEEEKRIEAERVAKQKEIEEIKKQAISEYKEKIEIKEIIKEKVVTESKEDLENKRIEFAKYRDSLDYDKYEKEDWKIVFYKKVWEFLI